MGAIDNSAYRNLNHVDTFIAIATASLRYLRDIGLLIAKNQSSATYYVPGGRFIDSLNQVLTTEDGHDLVTQDGKKLITQGLGKRFQSEKEGFRAIGLKSEH